VRHDTGSNQNSRQFGVMNWRETVVEANRCMETTVAATERQTAAAPIDDPLLPHPRQGREGALERDLELLLSGGRAPSKLTCLTNSIIDARAQF
jgi:hypothetical protein